LDYALAILFALFVWWFSTGAVLYLIGMPRSTVGLSMLAATAVAAMAILGIWVTSNDVTVASAYAAFACGLLVWAWHEMSMLTGLVTGPRTSACPESLRGWRRFVAATETLIYHELAILLTAVGLVALTWGAPNQFGALTFIVLWLARISSKLNVYFGVPNLTEEFLPKHLVYLKSYFRHRPMNLFFPFAVTAATVVTVELIDAAADAGSPFDVVGYTLLATLMALAVLEHWFLVLPLPAASLWNWGLSSRELEAELSAGPQRVDTHRKARRYESGANSVLESV
jgi:putative photosynthetic complex assembly protein 2